MGIQIAIQYRETPITYDIAIQQDKIYHLRLNGYNRSKNGKYIPEKIIIRRKEKIWISNIDNYEELISSLTNELMQFNPEASSEPDN